MTAEKTVELKPLRGRGIIAGVLNSEDFLRCKREETISEDKKSLNRFPVSVTPDENKRDTKIF